MAIDTSIIIPTDISYDPTLITSRRELDMVVRFIKGAPFDYGLGNFSSVLSYSTNYDMIFSNSFMPEDDPTLEYVVSYYNNAEPNGVITTPTRNFTSNPYIYLTDLTVEVEIEFVANQPNFDVYTYLSDYHDAGIKSGAGKAFYGLVKKEASYDTLVINDISAGFLFNGNSVQLVTSGQSLLTIDIGSLSLFNDWFLFGFYPATNTNSMWNISDVRWTQGLMPFCFYIHNYNPTAFIDGIYDTKNVKLLIGSTNREFDFFEPRINAFGFPAEIQQLWQNYLRTTEIER